MSRPGAQNFPPLQPTQLYAHRGSVGAPVLIWAAGRSVRIYPGGRKAATAVHSISFFPILIFSDKVKAPFFSSHPTGFLPGRVKSWLPLGRGISSEGSGTINRSPDRPANFRWGWSKIFPLEPEKIRLGYVNFVTLNQDWQVRS